MIAIVLPLLIFLVSALLNHFVFRRRFFNAGYLSCLVVVVVVLLPPTVIAVLDPSEENQVRVFELLGYWLVPLLILSVVGYRFSKRNQPSFPSLKKIVFTPTASKTQQENEHS